MTNVLITGAGGFLGGKLLNQLYKMNHYTLTIITSQKEKFLDDYEDIISYSFEEFKDGKVDFKNIDFIVNCAFARTSKPKDLASSLSFTSKLVSEAANGEVKGFLNISSQSVYSSKRLSAAKETDQPEPESLYAMAKYSTELIVENLLGKVAVPYSNIRLASLTGPGFEHRLTSRFVDRAIKNESISIQGGSQKISYLNGDKAVKSIITMIGVKSETWEPVYNLGVEDSYTLINIAETVKRLAKSRGLNLTVNFTESEEFMNNSLNNSLFYNDFKVKNRWNLEDDIEEIFNRLMN